MVNFKLPIGYTYEIGGQYESQRQAFSELLMVFAIGTFLFGFIILWVAMIIIGTRYSGEAGARAREAERPPAEDPRDSLVATLTLVLPRLFALDYAIDLWRAPDRGAHVRSHWFDLALIVVSPPLLAPPEAQALRVLRAARRKKCAISPITPRRKVSTQITKMKPWTMLTPSSRISCRVSIICFGSRPAVGSSRISTSGLCRIACARPTRCR